MGNNRKMKDDSTKQPSIVVILKWSFFKLAKIAAAELLRFFVYL